MDWNTQYLEWCEIMQMNKSRRDQIVFMAGMTWQSLASGAIRAEALRDAADRAVEWLNKPFGFDSRYQNKEEQMDASLIAAILGEVKE